MDPAHAGSSSAPNDRCLPNRSPEHNLPPAQRSAIIVLDPEQGTSRIILEGPAHYNFTAWSPTADLISFTADIDDDSDIYTIHSNGSDLRRLTRPPGNDAHQTWSPDGKWIAFASIPAIRSRTAKSP